MNNIQKRQNEEDLLRYLKAQRVAYSHAKNYQIVDLISVGIAIVPPILILYELNQAELVAVIGVFWTLISIFSELYRTKKSKIGAIIQDKFDSKLFELPRNKVLIDYTVDISKIIELSKQHNGDGLENWYSTEIKEDLPHNLAVLLCYKVNAIWGVSQRTRFINSLYVVTALYYGFMVFLAFYKNMGIFDVAVWLAPSIPFLVYVTSTTRSQYEIVATYQHISRTVDSLIEEFVEGKAFKEFPNKTVLRQIQDMYFGQRMIPHKVPNWFYKIFRDRTNEIANEAIRSIIKEINSAQNNAHSQ